MTPGYSTVLKSALELDLDERAILAIELQQTLHEVDPEVEAAWADEVERRIGEIDRGEATLVPGDQVLAEARARLLR